jgi:hypothetical protein
MKQAMEPSAIMPSPRRPPVRVKLQRINVDHGKLHPPDGQGGQWWEALKTALGTCSNAFVTASLAQLQGAARLPDGPVSETAMNAALALVEAVAPQNEIEGALAVQMAATHSASMAVLGRIGSAHSGYRLLTAYSNAASKLLRAYTAQVDALRRLRGGGAQHIRVEHIHVNDEAKAIIGCIALPSQQTQPVTSSSPEASK